MLAIRWVDRSNKSTCAAAGKHPAKAFVHMLLSICHVLAEGRPCSKLSLQAFHALATASQASAPHPCVVSNLHMHCAIVWTKVLSEVGDCAAGLPAQNLDWQKIQDAHHQTDRRHVRLHQPLRE